MKESAKSIFSINSHKYIKYEFKADDLDHGKLTDIRFFNIPEAEKKLEPLEREAKKKLHKYIKNKQSVIIQGPPAVGKTRLVFDVLRELRDGYVFSLNRIAFHEPSNFDISFNTQKKQSVIIWFIDDVHKLLELGLKANFDIIYETIIRKLKNIIVVATIRSGNYFEKIKLFKNMIRGIQEIELHKWLPSEAEKLIEHHGYSTERMNNFDGTPLSIVRGIDIMTVKAIFDSYKMEKTKIGVISIYYDH